MSPSAVTRTISWVSRSLTSALPSGRKATPHGTSRPSASTSGVPARSAASAVADGRTELLADGALLVAGAALVAGTWLPAGPEVGGSPPPSDEHDAVSTATVPAAITAQTRNLMPPTVGTAHVLDF
ncbi:hypothetical protein GCM10027265_03350 [Jatrophihabitans fulvus]